MMTSIQDCTRILREKGKENEYTNTPLPHNSAILFPGIIYV